MARYRLAVDVGGTFTDICVFDSMSNRVAVRKVSSVPSDPARAILDGIEATGIDPADIELFSHGTTIGTNALVQRTFPRSGLIATEGFRDILEIRRSTRPHLWDAYLDVGAPYVPRRDRLTVPERIGYDGEIVERLDEDRVRDIARAFRRRDIKSVAVCLLNSYANPAHEQRIGEILAEDLPGVPVTLSSDILPEIFEFERTSTTAANAVLAPVVGQYMEKIGSELRALGYERELLVLHSGGGVMSAETVPRYAAKIAASGPAGGAVAMSKIAQSCGFANAIGFDVGGTTSDISLMWDGQLRITRDWGVEYGYPIAFPSIELITIGAGGGSIARIDDGGALRSGPESAGASPGPAAYRRGGVEPTTTDANLVLGRLGQSLIGGDMTLDLDASREAIEARVGEPLGLDPVAAADAVVQVANANMTDAIRLVSIQKGYDPRDFALVAFGGAGPLHAAEVARGAAIPVVIIPPNPGVTSAYGCLLVDVRHDLTRTLVIPAVPGAMNQLEVAFTALEENGSERLAREGIAVDEVEIRRTLEMRYVGQWRHISVPWPGGEATLDTLLDTFHAEHEREYAYARPDQPVEVFGVGVTATGKIPKPSWRTSEPVTAQPEPVGARDVYLSAARTFTSVPLFARERLLPGMRFSGPAIVEQLDSTTFVPDEVTAEVDNRHNLVLQIS